MADRYDKAALALASDYCTHGMSGEVIYKIECEVCVSDALRSEAERVREMCAMLAIRSGVHVLGDDIRALKLEAE